MNAIREFFSDPYAQVLVGVSFCVYVVVAIATTFVTPPTITSLITVPCLAVTVVNVVMTLITLAKR